MASRTWVGGSGNNNIYQGQNWSPPGPIEPGDVLSLYSGTANMAGGDLSGDTLYVGTQTSYASSTPPAVVNLSRGADLTAVAATAGFAAQNVTFNASGVDTLNLSINNNYYATMNTTVNIAANARLSGTVAVGGHNGNLIMNGAAHSAFDNDGASSVGPNCVATINAKVLGIGSFSVNAESSLSFMSAVGPGESVILAGQDTLSIGMPQSFLGPVDIANGGGSFTIGLQGITSADSYSYAQDMLTLFHGNRPIDVLRLTDSSGIQVGETTTGVFIGSSSTTLPPGTVLLPQHGMS
ncbi:MAG TPA: hypothetical protein VMB34_00060 [Acetobacteraceae bacterium]|nr:hypothetical protein [Acetobacteraceae bacterium]